LWWLIQSHDYDRQSAVECSRKMAARIAELEDQAEQARIRAAKFEKDKMKLQIEIRDISVELEAVTSLPLLFLHIAAVVFSLDFIFLTCCKWGPCSFSKAFNRQYLDR